MEWWGYLVTFVVVLIVLLLTAMPVAYCFLVANFVLVGMVFGVEAGPDQLIRSMYEGVASFVLTPIPAFMLMGEVLFISGLASKTLDAMSKLLGRMPGRLSVLAVAGGVAFGGPSGSTIATTSLLGSVLVPDMQRRGYHLSMSAGPIMASGTLAMLIPPSAVAVLLASIGNISISDLLIAGVVPGFALAALFVAYIVIRVKLNPSLAPPYELEHIPLKEKVSLFVKDVLPLGIVLAIAIIPILTGWATSTEAASLGALTAILFAAMHRGLGRRNIIKISAATVRITCMILFIFAFASGFSELLSFSGSTREVVRVATDTFTTPIPAVIVMLVIVMLLGAFLPQESIMLVTLPLFIPVLLALDVNTVWFGAMMLMALDLGNLTPPFGFSLFVMKGVLPGDVPMTAIYKTAVPWVLIELVMITAVLIFPSIVLWLPGLGG